MDIYSVKSGDKSWKSWSEVGSEVQSVSLCAILEPNANALPLGRISLWSRARSSYPPIVQLHNRFLLALIYQANLPSFGPGSDSTRKRKRVTPEDAEFDINENAIVPKGRIQYWMMGIGGKERGRIRRAGRQQALEDADGDDDGARRVRAWGVQPGQLSVPYLLSLTQADTCLAGTTMPPLAASAKLLPASHQLSHRLSQLAKSYDLNLSPDALADIGEFMAVGMDAQLSDIFYSLLHLIARDRRGSETTKLNGHVNADEMDLDIKAESDGEMLKPDLRTLRALFSMNPGLHPSTSPALYKLAGALLQAEDEYNSPAVKEERKPSLSPDGTKDAGPESQKDRFETLTKRFVEEGLVKMDNPKKGEEDGGGKKDRKHNLHWKYEDPALILKDVFG